MNKKKITKDDGRYLVYYTFKQKSSCCTCSCKNRKDKEEKPSV